MIDELINQFLQMRNLHAILWQVEDDTGFDIVAISPISQEGDRDVADGDEDHANVHESAESGEILRRLHVFVNGQDQGNAFVGEQGRAEEQRQSFPRAEHAVVGDGRQVLEHVDQHHDDGEGQKEVSQEREGSQPSQIADPVQEYQRQRCDDHVNSRVPVHSREMNDELISNVSVEP